MQRPESARCLVCGAPLEPDEVALTRKLIALDARQFRCIDCLAAYFGCTAQRLREKADEFRRRGCVLFAPQPEGAPSDAASKP